METGAERAFRFSGTASEFFRIWIVNLCLSLVTVGLYSPWAKVRTRQYFYGNLSVAGSSFRYDADPVRILVGRLAVGGLLLLNALANTFLEPVAAILGLAFFLAIPWLATRSLAFHQRHTLYRGVRFGFDASYGEAAVVLLGWPILVLLSLGLAFPAWQARRQQFHARGSRYGAARFGFRWRAWPYYGVYLKAALALGSVLFFGLLVTQWRDRAVALPTGIDASGVLFLSSVLVWPVLAAVLAWAIVQAGTSNLFFGHARLGELRFRSELEPGPLCWIHLSNALAILLSVGLLVPWARVRLARYRADRLALGPGGDLDAFVESSRPGAGLGELASEAADAFDFDFDFGL